ncbi:hypothetical protein ACH52_1718 [Eubacterium limosum]|nr:hypothetical protein ACH52_1718 [Eubacterium limosum]
MKTSITKKLDEVIELMVEKAKRELKEPPALADDKSNDTVLALAALVTANEGGKHEKRKV